MLIGGMFYNYLNDSSVSKYRTETIGKIVDFKKGSRSDYILYYEYFVDNKKYTGSVGTTYFKCKGGEDGCIGESLKVFYSSKEPKYSQVNLGINEKYKRTVYLKE